MMKERLGIDSNIVLVGRAVIPQIPDLGWQLTQREFASAQKRKNSIRALDVRFTPVSSTNRRNTF
jgi:hypothetical protein